MPKIVRTETSAYIIDEENDYIIRNAGDGAGTDPDEKTEAIVATLRKDGQTIPLLQLYKCEVGSPMEMLIDVRGDGIQTYRLTTNVRSIEDTEV